MRFTHHVPMRWSDTDALGHVNNSRYLSYLEDSRIALLQKMGDEAPISPGLIAARIEIDYLRPLMLSNEPVEVVMWISRIGTKSFTIDHEINHEGSVVARAKAVIVGFDYGTQRSRELSEEERRVLATYQDSA